MNTEIVLVGKGKKARVVTRSEMGANSLPNNPTVVSSIVQLPQELPILLAGPIVKKVTAESVSIWLAASVDLSMLCNIYDAVTGAVLGNVNADPCQIGDKLFIYVATVSMKVPVNQILTYNFQITKGKDPAIAGFEGDILLDADEVRLKGLPLPSFFLAPPNSSAIHISHGSCRKFHAPGNNAIKKLEEELDANSKAVLARPAAFHMTGDQIYADDVDPEIIEGISQLGRIMLGWEERFPYGNKKIIEYTKGTRGFLEDYGFTADKDVAANHLLGFGDYAAMYVLAWSPDIWSWSGLRQPPSFTAKASYYASSSTRKALANIACYMICDDHEVTDDWNLNALWVRDTTNPVGRRLIANALGAYWAFQAFGNDGGGRNTNVRSAIESYHSSRGRAPAPFEDALLGFHGWHYTAPTSIPTIFLDTRTHRDFPVSFSPFAGATPPKTPVPAAQNPPPALLDKSALDNLRDSITKTGTDPSIPAMIVSPAPFIGYKKAEDGIARLAMVGDKTAAIKPAYEPEAWSYNDEGFAGFLKALAMSGRTRFVILGGDVHYGYTAIATCVVRSGENLVNSKQIALVQATSSALLNAPDSVKWLGLDMMHDDNMTYEMFGYKDGEGKYVLRAGTHHFVAPSHIPANWDIQMRWQYLRASPALGDHTIVVDNNVGFVRADINGVSHTLVEGSGTRHVASVTWNDILNKVPTPLK